MVVSAKLWLEHKTVVGTQSNRVAYTATLRERRIGERYLGDENGLIILLYINLKIIHN